MDKKITNYNSLINEIKLSNKYGPKGRNINQYKFNLTQLL